MARGRKSAAERRRMELEGSVEMCSQPEPVLSEPLRAASGGSALPLADYARQALEEMIVTLELKPGSTWSEVELSDRLGVGRTPVREALKRLELSNLVEIIPRSGVRVTEIDLIEYMRMLEMRRELERLIAVSAARRALDAERVRFVELANLFEAMEGIGGIEFLRHHYSAKRYLADCARNAFVARAIEPCYAMSRRFFYVYELTPHSVGVAGRHHAAIFRAAAGRDETAAARASDTLMDYVDQLARLAVR